MASPSGPVVTVGGKGAALSSDHVYAVSRSLSKVQIDASALDKLTQATSSARTSSLPPPGEPRLFLAPEESRAALLVVLNKLVHADARGVRSTLPVLIVEALNQEYSGFESLDFGSAAGLLTTLCQLSGKGVEGIGGGATADEIFVIQSSAAPSCGVCAVLDCASSALATVLDAVAALSCEAARVDISAFDSYVSGDGFSVKDRTDVASDMKVLLFSSKLTGRAELPPFTEIPDVHGSFREVVRMLHGRCRAELNSVVKARKTSVSGNAGKDRALAAWASHIADATLSACENSLGRLKLTIESNGAIELKSKLISGICKDPSFSLTVDGVHTQAEAATNHELDGFFDSLINKFRSISVKDTPQSAYNLLVKLQRVLAWEAAIALFFIEVDETIEKPQTSQSSAEINGRASKGDKKHEKKKKTLGKGTSILRQLLGKRLSTDNKILDITTTNSWAQQLSSLFDPKDPELDILLNKVKEIVQSNEVRRLPKIPKGTRDFGKDQIAIRERAFSIILGIFKRHGSVGLDTPVFELRETLMGKYGEDSKLIYDLADQGGEICSLRYDLTVPFARYLAMNNITSLKRYHIGKVYRRDNPSKGRYREFYQCDFDIAGQYRTMEPDFEVLKVLTELLSELEIGDFEIKLNHRKLLDGMLDICGVPSEKFRTVCSSIDKLDKQSFEQVKKELVEEKGLTVETADKISSFVCKRGRPQEVLSDLTKDGSPFLEKTESALALKDLALLFNFLEEAGSLDKIVFDLSLARGLDYYTGVIFEAVTKGITQVGSIAAGGRYDNLVGMFSGKPVPAVGISLGIERVFAIMEGLNQSGNQEIRPTETQILVAALGDDPTVAVKLVAKLWDAKIPAEFGVHKKVMKHIERARDGGIPWMVIIGELEREKGVVKLKDIKENKEEEVAEDKIIEVLCERLRSLQSSSRRYFIV